MSFRAERASTYASIRSRATQLKRLAQDSHDLTLDGPVSASAVRQLLDLFIQGKAEMEAAAQVPGMAEYAQAQEGDPNYDVATEFGAMISAAGDVIAWIVAAVPKSDGYVLHEQWSANGVTVRTFATNETAGLRSVLNAFIATVG